MKLSVRAVAVACLAVALAPHVADAHGYISQPKASYKPNTIYTNFNAEITASVNPAFAGKIFNHAPEDNAKVFTAAWPQTGYKSLKEMLDPAAPDCGLSLPDVAPIDVSSMTEFKFQNNEYKEGFIASHRGPCELWIGDTRAWHYDDCAAKFPGYPATIPTDFSVCKGTCRVTFYWLALHSPNWQIYKQCVPVKNGNAAAIPAATPAPVTTKPSTSAPATTKPTTPKPTTKAPATSKPTVTPATSSDNASSGKKCTKFKK
uniref:Chitin-binding type-4 domain-containing protein n=1 Tax=Globisporangium ultimum (strain ATCC 200006 / CBS 805.95 / DAOM BR144) TaxID=431595 RepID=K3WLN9_GLOUD